MELYVIEDNRHFTFELKVPKTTRHVRGLVQLIAVLERADLRPEAREAFLKLKELWEKNYSSPEA